MFRIGEFSILTSISIHMLRNYDKINLLSPEFTDGQTGYRYYSENQLLTANRIQALKAMGLGLKDISDMLKEDSFGESYQLLLSQKIEEKKKEIQKLNNEILQLELSIEKVQKNEDYVCDVAVKAFPKRNVIGYRSIIHDFPEEGRLWEHLTDVCKKNKVRLVTNGFSAAIQHEHNDKHFSDVEVVFEVEKIMNNIEDTTFYQFPACEVASIAFQGQYFQIGNINYHLGKWIIRNNYEICGSPFCVYHISPGNSNDTSAFLTEICFPIKMKKQY